MIVLSHAYSETEPLSLNNCIDIQVSCEPDNASLRTV